MSCDVSEDLRPQPPLCAAAAASIGVGLFSDLTEAADTLVQWDRNVEPNHANRAIYDEAKERWQAAYAVQKELVDKGVTTPMWSAPGALMS